MKKYSKDQIPYWKDKVRPAAYTVNGERRSTAELTVRILYEGTRRVLPLGTSNKEIAAEKARDLYLKIRSEGWTGIPKKITAVSPKTDDEVTLGDILKAYRTAGILKTSTFSQYEGAIRKIVADLAQIKGDNNRFGKKGAKEWQKKVDACALHILTKESIEQWRHIYVKNVPSSSTRLSRQRSCNTYFRNAKSLFSDKHLKKLHALTGFTPPIASPFEGLERLPEGSHRYFSKIDPAKLSTQARNELRDQQPEVYKLFILSLVLGLRRGEADMLKWDAFDFERKMLTIQGSESFDLKTVASHGELHLPDQLAQLFTQYHKCRNSVYVIESDVAPRKEPSYRHYRANYHEEKLVAWLRSKGVTAQKPIHTLRKEMGRILAERHGIYAASKKLRHGDLSVTVKHYSDDKRVLETGLEDIFTEK